MNCQSCGMPMDSDKQHGGGDPSNKFCIYCTDAAGKLKTREQVRQGMIAFFMKARRLDETAAAKFVDDYMKNMPAWKKKKK
jgi:hypothetical protein